MTGSSSPMSTERLKLATGISAQNAESIMKEMNTKRIQFDFINHTTLR